MYAIRSYYGYFRFAIQIARVFEFYGFRNILCTFMTDLGYGNRDPAGLGYYYLNLFPVKRVS